jgi:hypothetical protein
MKSKKQEEHYMTRQEVAIAVIVIGIIIAVISGVGGYVSGDINGFRAGTTSTERFFSQASSLPRNSPSLNSSGNFSFARSVSGYLNVFNGTYAMTSVSKTVFKSVAASGKPLILNQTFTERYCTIANSYIIIGNGSTYDLNSSYVQALVESGLNDTPFCNRLNVS